MKSKIKAKKAKKAKKLKGGDDLIDGLEGENSDADSGSDIEEAK